MNDPYRPLFVEVRIEPEPPQRKPVAWPEEKWVPAWAIITAGGGVLFSGLGAADVMVLENFRMGLIRFEFTRACGHRAACRIDDRSIYLRDAPDIIAEAFAEATPACYCVLERDGQ